MSKLAILDGKKEEKKLTATIFKPGTFGTGRQNSTLRPYWWLEKSNDKTDLTQLKEELTSLAYMSLLRVLKL